jgi:hypothetical protein
MTIATTSDNEYFLASVGNFLQQFRIEDHTYVKHYWFSDTICSTIATFDQKNIFVGLTNGTLEKICLENLTVVRFFGKIRHKELREIVVTSDSKFLITCGSNGSVKKISIESQEVVQDFGRVTRDYNKTV